MLTLILLLTPLCLGRRVYAEPLPLRVFDTLQESIDSISLPMVSPDTLVDSLSLDSLFLATDSLSVDTLAVDSVSTKPEGGGLTAVVNYKAQDSLVFAAGNMAWLYGSSQVT